MKQFYVSLNLYRISLGFQDTVHHTQHNESQIADFVPPSQKGNVGHFLLWIVTTFYDLFWFSTNIEVIKKKN